MPPGREPASSAKTASALRREFLKTNPALGITSKNRFLLAIKSWYKMDKPETKGDKIPDLCVVEIK